MTDDEFDMDRAVARTVARLPMARVAKCFVCCDLMSSQVKPIALATIPRVWQYGGRFVHPGCREIAAAERRMLLAMARPWVSVKP